MTFLKGFSLIGGVIFLALTISAAVIIYQAGLPAVQELQATAAVDKMKSTLSELDSIIRAVAGEGQGSKRTVFISSEPGILTINGTANTIIWELETTAPVISPRTSQQFGNLIVGSNLEASVEEGNFTRVSPEVPAFIMRNAHLDVYINRTGSPSSQTPISTNALVLAIYNKDLDSWLDNPGFLEISIDSQENSKSGTGYTQAEALGDNLPFGKVTAFMDTTYLDYNLFFILESGADFLTIEAGQS